MGILVTGGAGFIGSHMVLALLEDVVVVDNLSSGFDTLVGHSLSWEGRLKVSRKWLTGTSGITRIGWTGVPVATKDSASEF